MKVTVLYVGTSLLSPLKDAEREINRAYKADLRIAAHNFGATLDDDTWQEVNNDLAESEVVFVIHVMDGENGERLLPLLDRHKKRHAAVIVINCMPELMRKTRMGKLNVAKLSAAFGKTDAGSVDENAEGKSDRAMRLFGTASTWIGRQARRSSKPTSGSNGRKNDHSQYLKLVNRLPGILRFVPGVGAMRDVKNYLNIFCYFLQPTPSNIRSMLLSALKEYVADSNLNAVELAPPEKMPSLAIYHPDAPQLFESFANYQSWYEGRPESQPTVEGPRSKLTLDCDSTIGLLLMRPQVVSKTTRHYDALIRALEVEDLAVIPALSTLMDNREAVSKFFLKEETQALNPRIETEDGNGIPATERSRVSQIVSLTGFSFVGGPAMNDSDAASRFLKGLNRPYRSAVSLDTQTINGWLESQTGLNPVQAGMQIAIPEIDGATEPFIYGGIPDRGVEPAALDERCTRLARRLKRWNRLRTVPRDQIKLALVLFCFPPNKGNIGTAADLDVFPGLWETLRRFEADGYRVEVPESPETLREMIIAGNAENFAATANVAYQMDVEEYRRLNPYVTEVEKEWSAAPGGVNTFAGRLLIQGIQLGNVFVGVEPTLGYEGDPMRMMMARSGAPHHGFMAFYTYIARVFNADAVVHVGTHGAMEFMPGKQVGMSEECWPDRLIGELPNIYIYSVNNPSEGSIAKRRSYAELISYLTPPIENAGLYKELATLKDLLSSYRQATDEVERESLFQTIEECSRGLNFPTASMISHYQSPPAAPLA